MLKELKSLSSKAYLRNNPRYYNANGVTYIVTSSFDDKKNIDVKKRFEIFIKNNATALTNIEKDSKITEDYVDLTVGKED